MKKQSSFQQTPPFDLRPASVEEAGLFYSNDERDEALGTVGHLRMDFGSSRKVFHHTWWPHNGDRFNTPEFKEALQEFVDAMRQNGPLKDLATTAYTDLSRKRSNTVSVCAAPPGRVNTRATSTATTSASRSWPVRTGW